MKKSLLITILLIGSCLACLGQTYEKMTFKAEDGTELNYRLLKPENEADGKEYPLVIFLHGLGERGDDNEKQLTHCSQAFLNPATREKYPAYVLFPQCPSDIFWAYKSIPQDGLKPKADEEMPAAFRAVKELIESYCEMPSVDRRRVYLMGLSMGAYATYDLVSRFPEFFAAAVPICGSVDPDRLADIDGVSFRIFHGDADPVVPVEGSRNAYRALKKAGVKVDYVEFPGCGHGSWDPALGRDDYMEWVFKQKKAKKYMK